MQYLIDASVYVFRAYYSIPDDMRDAEGNPYLFLEGQTIEPAEPFMEFSMNPSLFY